MRSAPGRRRRSCWSPTTSKSRRGAATSTTPALWVWLNQCLSSKSSQAFGFSGHDDGLAARPVTACAETSARKEGCYVDCEPVQRDRAVRSDFAGRGKPRLGQERPRLGEHHEHCVALRQGVHLRVMTYYTHVYDIAVGDFPAACENFTKLTGVEGIPQWEGYSGGHAGMHFPVGGLSTLGLLAPVAGSSDPTSQAIDDSSPFEATADSSSAFPSRISIERWRISLPRHVRHSEPWRMGTRSSS